MMTETEKLKNALFNFERATGCKVMQIRISERHVKDLAIENNGSSTMPYTKHDPITFNGVALSIGEW